MKSKTIKTYSTEGFREKYIHNRPRVDEMLKSGFGKFFITRVEELIRSIRLPVPPARSSTHTFIYLTDGEAVMDVGRETYTVYRDECLVVPAGQVFAFANVDINQGFIFNFHNDMLAGKYGRPDLVKEFEFLQVWGNPHIKLDARTSALVRHLFERLLLEYTEHGLERMDILQTNFITLLCEINRAYRPQNESVHKQAVHISNRFRELLYIHVKQQHQLAFYASELHITPNHLNKSVKLVTGKPPGKWIDEALITEAKILLHQSGMSVGELAAEIGFLDASYFARLFKKYEGVSPTEFRRKIEKSL